MYHIDFKVSAKIVSIPINCEDSLTSLISKIKGLDLFNRYSMKELEEKIITQLEHIYKSNSLEDKIKLRIEQLLKFEPKQSYNKISSSIKQSEKTKTFVRTLEQTTGNSVCLTNQMASEIELRKKYDLKNNLLDSPEKLKDKLKYNYDKQRTQQHRIKLQNSKVMGQNNPDTGKYSYKYLQACNPIERIQCRDLRNLQLINFNQKQLNSVRQNKQSKSFTRNLLLRYDKLNQNQVFNEDKFIKPQNDRYNNQTFEFSKKQSYNPVSRLNQLIEKSKSLSQIRKKDLEHQLKQKNKGTLVFQSTQQRGGSGKIQRQQNTTIKNANLNIVRNKQNSFSEVEPGFKIDYARYQATKRSCEKQYQAAKNLVALNSECLKQQKNNQKDRKNRNLYSYL